MADVGMTAVTNLVLNYNYTEIRLVDWIRSYPGYQCTASREKTIAEINIYFEVRTTYGPVYIVPVPSTSHRKFGHVHIHTSKPVAPVVQVVNLEFYLCLSPGFEPQVGRTLTLFAKK